MAECKDKQAQGSGRNISYLTSVCAQECAHTSSEGLSSFLAANTGSQVGVLGDLSAALQTGPSCLCSGPSSSFPSLPFLLPCAAGPRLLKETARHGGLHSRQIPALGSNSSSKESGNPSAVAKDCRLTELSVPLAELHFAQQSGFLLGQWVA